MQRDSPDTGSQCLFGAVSTNSLEPEDVVGPKQSLMESERTAVTT
jgi:hypothetical protein